MGLQRWLSCIYVLWLCFVSIAVTASQRDCDSLCGPKCLAVICQSLGVETNLSELASLCEADSRGTNLNQLAIAARKKGLAAQGVKISLEQLQTLDTHAILHLWSNHFVVVQPGHSNDMLTITDPPASPVPVSREQLRKLYSGFALLVSTDSSRFPASEVDGPDLRLSKYLHDFGVASEGDIVNFNVRCRNVGNRPLVISDIKTSCNCVMVLPSSITIPAGDTAELRVIVDTTGKWARQDLTVYLLSNDAVTSVSQLHIVGVVKRKQVHTCPSRVQFGQVRTGQAMLRNI